MNHWMYYHNATTWCEVFLFTVRFVTISTLAIILYLMRKRIAYALTPRSVPQVVVLSRSRGIGA